jgi:DNA-binding transcriptional MerR regulator
MDKSPDAFRTISEVADALETPAHVLRFWETRFPQIKPVKRAGGRRYYRPSDVSLLTGIKRLLHEDGLTIRGVQKILREQGIRHVAALADGAQDPHDRSYEHVDIVDDTGADDAYGIQEELPLAAAAKDDTVRPDLWPDADLPPPDDNGTLVLRLQPAPAKDAPTGLAAMSDPGDVSADAGLADAAPSVDADDTLIASIIQTATEPTPAPPPRAHDGWRSLPLAAGEDMPMAARLRALPRGALIPRAAEVASWTLRARNLGERMRQAGHGGTDGSPSP